MFKKLNPKFLMILLAGALYSCGSGDTDPSPVDNSISNDLHFNFTTPDWTGTADMNTFNMTPYQRNDSTNVIISNADSIWTTSYFSYPVDSSQIVKKSNLKRYKIATFGEFSGRTYAPFEFALRVPVTKNNQINLRSIDGLSDNSYNEIVAINYVMSNNENAFFSVKCRYKMQALQDSSTIQKEITGTYHFMVTTSRK